MELTFESLEKEIKELQTEVKELRKQLDKQEEFTKTSIENLVRCIVENESYQEVIQVLQLFIWITIIICIIKAIHSLIIVFKSNDKDKVAQNMIDSGIGLFISYILFMFSKTLQNF